MNIFAVSPNPTECAQALDDKRLNKMVTETAQLLSNAVHKWGFSEADRVYKLTHRNHPCTMWVCEKVNHFGWTITLLDAMREEWYHRTDLFHGAGIRVADPLISVLDELDEDDLSPTPSYFPNCTPYNWVDVHAAYRQTLCDKWYADAEKGRPPQWTNRSPPTWA